jgi:hypothetical protein
MAQVVEQEDVQELYDWLFVQAKNRPVGVVLHTDWATQDGRFIIIPARVDGDPDAYDQASILQDIEDSWNNRRPRPHWLAILRPTAK